MSSFKEEREGNLSMLPGHRHTKQYLAISKIYPSDTKYLAHSLSCKQNIFLPLHQQPASKGEHPKALSWPYPSPRNLKVFGLWVMCDSLYSRGWCTVISTAVPDVAPLHLGTCRLKKINDLPPTHPICDGGMRTKRPQYTLPFEKKHDNTGRWPAAIMQSHWVRCSASLR